MADSTNTFAALARELGHALAPLEHRLKAGQITQLFVELGLAVPGATVLPPAFVLALGDTATAAAKLPPVIAQLEAAISGGETGALLSAAIALTKVVVDVVTALQALGAALDANAAAFAGMSPADIAALAAELAERLAEYCLINYLEGYWPRVLVGLRVLGLVDYELDPGRPGDPTRPPSIRKSLHLDRIAKLVQDPGEHFEAIYGWGSSTFDAQRLLETINAVLLVVAVPSLLEPAPGSTTLDQLVIGPFRLVPEPTATPPGISLRFDLELGSNLAFRTPFLAPNWVLDLAVTGALGTGVGVMLQPPATASFVPAAGSAGVRVTLSTKPPQPITVLQIDAGSRISVAELDVFFEFDVGTTTELIVGAKLKGGRVVIDTSQSDGFLQKLLSGVHIDSSFDLGLSYSSASGIHIDGAAALAIQLASHIDLGPLSIDALTFSVGFAGGSIPVGLTTNLSATLGPLSVAVEEIGFDAIFKLASGNSGNLGPLDLATAFHPPKGAGLAIDTGIVVGGGYLYFDPEHGEYAGVAELSIAELVTVKAIGLVTTKMPDGTNGFSLLVIISAEFTPIQLGFGFTLNGVGGLLGLNRSVVLDALRDGVRTGAINSIMFPANVVANAPRIISDLKAVFPPKEGTFLVGPMAKLGWGTPSLVTLSLGIIIEIPPGNIAILGVLALVLPDADADLIKIQVNFLGVLDFDEQLLSFDASLFDSHVLFLTLSGDMAVRLKWGDNAGFLLSVGGFHPSFTPPPGLHLPASMKRLTISILDTDWARIKIDNYFAVTSNTVQFGAHAYLFFGVSGANISGEVGFDVLFQFSPFYFNALITGSLAISVFGADLLSISLRFSLEGPTPWHAKGTGSISILFFSIDVNFDTTWGDPANTTLPPVSVMPLFVAEIEKAPSWVALPPPAKNLFVSLRALDPAMLVLHPFGALTIAQRAIPLGLELEKLGNQAPDDVSRVDITSAVAGVTALPLAEVDEQFAIAQFQELDDADKLSRPSYQPIKGGVTVGSAEAAQSSAVTTRTIAYEIVIEDKIPQRPLPKGRLYRAHAGTFHAFLGGSAIARSPISHQVTSALRPFTDTIKAGAEGFTVAKTHDNTPHGTASTFTSEAKARDYLRAQIAANPALDGTLHVLPAFEVNA